MDCRITIGQAHVMVDKALTPEEVFRNREALKYLPPWLRYRGLSQRSLADAMGVSEPTISKWLSGKQSMTVAQFSRIASLLNAKPSDILFSPEDKERLGRYERLARIVGDLPDDTLDVLIEAAERMRHPKTG